MAIPLKICWISMVCSVCLLGVSAMGAVQSPPPLGQLVIQAMEQQIEKQVSSVSDPSGAVAMKQAAAPFIDYLHRLGNDWTGTLNRSPHELPEDNSRGMHEAFQFYFAGRTNFEDLTISSLLVPHLPLQLDKAKCSEAQWHDFEIAGMRLRLAWLRLFLQLHPKEVLANDPYMVSITTEISYINDFSRNIGSLDNLITPDDFNIIMNTIEVAMPLCDDYKAFAVLHGSKLPRIGAFRDPENYFKNMRDQFGRAVENMYSFVWKENPLLLESRMRALDQWINDELDYAETALNAALKLKDGKHLVTVHYQAFLTKAVEVIADANIPHATRTKGSMPAKPLGNDIVLVRELNKYLRFGSRQFDVDYVSKSSNALSSLQTGNWKAYLGAPQLDDASADLTLPIAELVDYAKRHRTDEFKADVEHIRARLEGLEDLADTTSTQ